MDVNLLVKLFGQDQRWHAPCTVLVDAEASIQTIGSDSIVSGGAKVYAPRTISGRIAADTVSLVSDGSALLVLQQFRTRQSTGEEITRQTLLIIDPAHVVGLEFTDLMPLSTLGIDQPMIRTGTSGIFRRP